MRAFLILTLLFLTACGQADDTSHSPPQLGSGTLAWTSFPVPLRVDSAFATGARKRDLALAMQYWESRAGRKLFTIVGTWNRADPPFSGTMADPGAFYANVIEFEDRWPFAGREAGQTIVHSEGDAITNAVVLLSPSVRICTGSCQIVPGATSLRRLIAHELGHLLGLGHSADPNNIMYPEIQPGASLGDRTYDRAILSAVTK